MRILRRIVLVVLVLVIVLGAIGVGGFLYLTRRPFPQADGTLRLAGLTAPVTIIRDKFGIPHTYASNVHDLFFAQGYVHAQDRLWEMEASRMGISGRTSELSLSTKTIEQDKFVRTLGWRRAARADYNALSGEGKAILQAYADGVNAFITTHQDSLPIEFLIVGLFGSKGPGYKPEAWTPIDTLQFAKVMAWRLSGNWEQELFRTRLLAGFSQQGVQAIADLQPSYDYQNRPIIVPGDVAWERVPAGLAALQRLDALSGPRGRGIGSNNWVVAGSRTTTGLPLLANDPHLGFQMPSIWYFNSLHCDPVGPDCPYDVIGASFPGVPGIIIGHNARIAWGVTNVGPDVQDLFLEKVTGSQYEFQGRQIDLTFVPETMTIKGKLPEDYEPSPNETSSYDAATNTTTITLSVRYTRHGPLISDVSEDFSELDYPVAFAWTAINAPEKVSDSFLSLNRAQNWDEFREALRMFGTPSQNFVYADMDGNIGYQMPGRIPIRAKGDGQLPVPGWTGEYEWTGYIPFDELPSVLNPPQGYIVTANNAVVGPDYSYFLSLEWDRGYRARRIVDLIESKDTLSPDDMSAIQSDDLNLSAQEIVPYLSALSVEGDAQKVLDAIRQWDFHEHADRVGAAAYQVFWLYLLRDTFDDDLGELAADYVNGDDLNRQAMALLLAQPDSKWWDDAQTTDRVETRDDILKKSLADAARALTAEFGGDPSQWTWGRLHTVTFKSQALGDSPVSSIFNRGPFAVSGNTALVNNTGGSFDVAYPKKPGDPAPRLADILREQYGPSLRIINDLSDWNASRYIHTTGQSGLPYHPHYEDMIQPWLKIEYAPMWWERADLEKNAEGTLSLTP